MTVCCPKFCLSGAQVYDYLLRIAMGGIPFTEIPGRIAYLRKQAERSLGGRMNSKLSALQLAAGSGH